MKPIKRIKKVYPKVHGRLRSAVVLFVDKRQAFRYNVVAQRERSGVDLADINPFRYRGYLYDYEFGLYYLQSRYYDPELCRFVNADEPVMLNVSKSIIPNLYTYCDNDPVNYMDPTGYLFITTTMLICAGIGAIVGTLVGWGYYKYFDIPSNRAWIYILGGALIGAFLGGCVGYAASGGGAVLWSGTTAKLAAAEFARQNGLAVLSQTLRGKLLQILQIFLPYSTMRHLWEAESIRFLLSYAKAQKYVHIFIDSNAYTNIESIFNRIEMQVISELGFKIIWHFLK